MNQNWGYIFPKKLLLRAYSSLKHSLSTIKITYRGEMKIFLQTVCVLMWPVDMTGKTEGWLVNSPISTDIACRQAVISMESYVQVQLKASYVCIGVYCLHNSVLLLYFFRCETICSRSHGTNKQDTVYLTQCGKSWIQKYQWVLIHCNSNIFCSQSH